MGERGAMGSTAERTSLMSLHFAAKTAARADQAGSSRRRCAYSFMVLLQPAALMTMVSTLAASKVAIIFLAYSAAVASRPEWTMSAPQQPCDLGMITSKPSAARTRAVAALTCAKKASRTQPESMPTRPRDLLLDATVRGSEWKGLSGTGGSRASIDWRRAGKSLSRPEERTSDCRPVRW